MKNINKLILLLFVVIGFASCQKDEIVTINQTAEDGTTFVLNNSQYENYTYVLDEVNASEDMDALTCQQPDYGFTAAVTYYVQTSFNANMSDSVELATSVTGEKVAINTKDMAKAMLQLYNGQMPKPTVAKDVYVRLRAVISTATPTPFDTIPTVKPSYSNIIKLNVKPYYMQDLVPYNEAKKLVPYFLIGIGGEGHWDNSTAGLGSSLIPMSVVEGNKYDSDGKGTWSYTGYFTTSDEFKLVRDYKTGSWDEQWGNQSAVGINAPVSKAIVGAEPSNFQVPTDGYYTITLNSITNTLTIEANNDITPTVYDSMGLTGNLSELTVWGAGATMTARQTTNNHVWYISSFTLSADATDVASEGCKFRSGDTWIGGTYFPVGRSGAGTNILFSAGTYTVIFNDLDGCYYFIAN